MEKREDKILSFLSTMARYLVLILFAIITLFPFYWMLVTALGDPNMGLSWPPALWPTEWRWENFAKVNEIAPFATYFRNTIIVVILDLSCTLVVVSLAAFGFAHFEFKGREVLFLLVLATMMIPSESLTITNFRTISRLNWVDSYQALFVPYIAGAFNIYILREAFLGVPRQLYLAAKVDGCSDFKYFLKILLPISRPTLITIALLKVIATWNAFLWPLLVTNSKAMRVISYGLVNFQYESSSNYVLMMAASIYTVLPMLILYLVARKQIINGIAKGGMKG